jgi:DNA-binding NarL/FixJ family response regulator
MLMYYKYGYQDGFCDLPTRTSIEVDQFRGLQMRVIRVVVADDDPSFRSALIKVLEADSRFLVVGVVTQGDALVALANDTRPDLVVLDVRMPGGGPVAARALRQAAAEWEAPVPVVVALTAQSDVATVVAMLREGATAYLVKGRVGADLPDLLVRSAEGEVLLAVNTGAQALQHLLADST